MWNLILCFILGWIAGSINFAFYMANRIFGTLKMMPSDDSDGPYLYLDMDKKPENIEKYKYVVFKVDIKQPSQK